MILNTPLGPQILACYLDNLNPPFAAPRIRVSTRMRFRRWTDPEASDLDCGPLC